ncbi:saccharopine dehydrogenase NADP-binding domain-containing protein [Streptomyces mayonensis]|uniref:saccharopine dehydrogenase NADP-binding domain-containing protein n=1 Tax=Streptomyces mayonensis TaxID=2750816 RepID=UPI001C1E67D0|nr:saccharopine dehydrogenase NADP-binding domain-containing protein [Streptomyces sp. A108]MBU6535671.1 saccharopine dehydrogenase NADP-binding domain-containing protein [Streptomyces sp. A108]
MIGIVGASGAVGHHAAAALARAGAGPLRLGARRPEAIRVRADGADVETRAVDALDAASLAGFSAGCRVVLNCAGPSYELKDTVAGAALAAGADYVDVLGDDPVHEALTAAGAVPAGRAVVLSAGTVPGLSLLVHRRLTELAEQDATRATRLVAYAGGLERATATVAADILLSLDVGGAGGERYGQPLAAWRNGRRVPRALRVNEDAEVPHYPQRVALQPLLTAEIERGARATGLAEAEWYNVFPGSQVRALFTALPTLPVDTPEQREDLVRRIIRAGEIDLAGAEPYYRLVLTLSGPDRRRTAVVRTDDSYRLTGAVAAHTVRSLVDGRIPPGLHFAGDVLEPAGTIDELTRTGAADFSVYEGEGHAGERAGDDFEDGEL